MGQASRAERERGCAESMQELLAAHREVGGEVVSAGGTGTYDCNCWATEIQAGSYALMDTAYHRLGLSFAPALWLLATVISVSESWAVADCGLKALGMDHGNPEIPGARVLFCSDEHLTFVPGRAEAGAAPDASGAQVDKEAHARSPIGWTSPASARAGDRIRIVPAHVDPTVAYHERFYVLDGDDVVDEWPIDLRGW